MLEDSEELPEQVETRGPISSPVPVKYGALSRILHGTTVNELLSKCLPIQFRLPPDLEREFHESGHFSFHYVLYASVIQIPIFYTLILNIFVNPVLPLEGSIIVAVVCGLLSSTLCLISIFTMCLIRQSQSPCLYQVLLICNCVVFTALSLTQSLLHSQNVSLLFGCLVLFFVSSGSSIPIVVVVGIWAGSIFVLVLGEIISAEFRLIIVSDFVEGVVLGVAIWVYVVVIQGMLRIVFLRKVECVQRLEEGRIEMLRCGVLLRGLLPSHVVDAILEIEPDVKECGPVPISMMSRCSSVSLSSSSVGSSFSDSAQDSSDRVSSLVTIQTSTTVPDQTGALVHHTSRILCEIHDDIAVGFVRINGFEKIETTLTPKELIILLDRMYTTFDAALSSISPRSLYRLKVISQTYMFLSGVPVRNNGEENVELAVLAALKILREVGQKEFGASVLRGGVSVSIGLDVGRVLGGVVNTNLPQYDVWSDVVNVASILSESCPLQRGGIHVTEKVIRKIESKFDFGDLESHEKKIKDRGTIPCFYFTQAYPCLGAVSDLSLSDIQSPNSEEEGEFEPEDADIQYDVEQVHEEDEIEIASDLEEPPPPAESSSSGHRRHSSPPLQRKPRDPATREFLLKTKLLLGTCEKTDGDADTLEPDCDSKLAKIAANEFEHIREFGEFELQEGIPLRLLWKFIVFPFFAFRARKLSKLFQSTLPGASARTNRIVFGIFLAYVLGMYSGDVWRKSIWDGYSNAGQLLQTSFEYWYMALARVIGCGLGPLVAWILVLTPLYTLHPISFHLLNFVSFLVILFPISMVTGFFGDGTESGPTTFLLIFLLVLVLRGVPIAVSIVELFLTLAAYLVLQNVRYPGLLEGYVNQLIVLALFVIAVPLLIVHGLKEMEEFIFRGEMLRRMDRLEEISKGQRRLLATFLPRNVLESILDGTGTPSEGVIACVHNGVSLLCCDIDGFSPFVQDRAPSESLMLLRKYFETFDRLAIQHRLCRLKFVGDAVFMCSRADSSSAEVALCALALAKYAKEDRFLSFRIGIHRGDVLAGVIGRNSRPQYDLFGSTMHFVKQFEQTAITRSIHCSTEFAVASPHKAMKRAYHFVRRNRRTTICGFEIVSYWLRRGRKKMTHRHRPSLPSVPSEGARFEYDDSM